MWQQIVKDELAERAMQRKELAEAIDVTPAAITVLLRPETRSSRLVDDVSRVLQIPTPEFEDERDAQGVEALRLLRRSDPAEYDRTLARIDKRNAEVRDRPKKE